MARSTPEHRRKARVKAGFGVYYAIFLLFVYGPMFAMFVLSFQGPRGGVTFPMRGLSFFWWAKLTGPSTVGDLKASLGRSLILASSSWSSPRCSRPCWPWRSASAFAGRACCSTR